MPICGSGLHLPTRFTVSSLLSPPFLSLLLFYIQPILILPPEGPCCLPGNLLHGKPVHPGSPGGQFKPCLIKTVISIYSLFPTSTHALCSCHSELHILSKTYHALPPKEMLCSGLEHPAPACSPCFPPLGVSLSKPQIIYGI